MSNPKDVVKKYLDKNGYPFEMLVAKYFKNAGFEIYQSMIYRDKETGKDREIDVIAYFTRYFKDIEFSFKIIIECKHASTPWILFTGENTGFSNLPIETFYCANFAGKKLLEALSVVPSFSFENPFIVDRRIAYGITETSEGHRDQDGKNSYKALMTLLNVLKYEREIDKSGRGKVFEIFIPIIAIQGKLFECFLNDNNDEVVQEIDEGQLLYKSNIYPDIFPMVEVVTDDKIMKVAKKLFEGLDSIYKNNYSSIGYLLDNYPVPGFGVF